MGSFQVHCFVNSAGESPRCGGGSRWRVQLGAIEDGLDPSDVDVLQASLEVRRVIGHEATKLLLAEEEVTDIEGDLGAGYSELPGARCPLVAGRFQKRPTLSAGSAAVTAKK